jgi:adenylate cyclase
VRAVRVGDVFVPTQPNGDAWLHFSAFRQERYIPAAEVLERRVAADAIKDKIVIVALTGVIGVDSKTTPLDKDAVPGAEVHAQLIESLYDRRFLERPIWMPWVEVAILIVFGGVLIWLAPKMRRDPAILLAVGLLGLVAACGFALFQSRGLLFDAFSLIVALATVFSSVIASALVRADHERRATEGSLQAARESAARVAGELEAARRIQLGILPNAATSFPAERRFELAAALEPARAVGGDLYDFFMLDENRLFVLIGDVSGKGIPASLLMSIAKALTKSIALRPGGDAAQVLSQANIEVSRDNPESQFITAFAAVLDIETGLLRYWTAGHDTPFLRNSVGAQQIDRALSGPPLCVLEQFEYREQQLSLQRGESLTLFTDGITEAENAGGEQFGKPRVAQCLIRLPIDASANEMLEALRAEVGAFVGAAQPSDDLTLLIVRWLGRDSPSTASAVSSAVLSAP